MDASQLRGLEELQTEVKDTLGQLPAETRSHAITSIRGVLTGLRQSQTIEEIVHGNAGHRQKEVLAMLSSLGSVLRHDLPIVTAAMLAEIDEAPLFGKGLHVVSTGEDGEVVKGIVDEFDSSDNQCRVIQTDGSLSDWIKSKDIVLDDEASEDNGKILNHLREGKTKNVQDVKQQIMSDFDELCADMAKGDKAHWLDEDSNYKQTLIKVIDFKHDRLKQFVKETAATIRDECYYDGDETRTCLHFAARDGRAKVLAALLATGASAAAVDCDGATSLIYALGDHGSDDDAAKEAAAHVLLLPTISAGALETSIKAGYYGRKTTALMLASRKGLAGTVKKLLEGGARADVTDEDGTNALMMAIGLILDPEPDQRQEATAEALLEATVAAGALNEQLQSGSLSGGSALMLASASGMVNLVEKMLAAGAKVEMVDADGETSLMYAIAAGKRDFLNGDEPRAGQWAVARMLLAPTHAAGAIDAQSSKTDYNRVGTKLTALMLASDAGMVDVVEKLLTIGAKADICDNEGRTCLMRVLKDGPCDETVADLLLGPTASAGALNNQSEDYSKETALMHASSKGMVGVVKKLLAAGALPEMTNGQGDTSLKLSIGLPDECNDAAFELLAQPTVSAGALDAQGCGGRSALMQAVALGQVQMVDKLLNLGAKIDLTDVYGSTSLHLACTLLQEAQGKSMVEKLLLHGAKADATEERGKTSLIVAIENNREEIAEVLFQPTLAAGALDVKATARYPGYSQSALIHASRMGMASMVEKLLAAGVDAKYDISVADDGWGTDPGTALELARGNGHAACVAILEQHLSSI